MERVVFRTEYDPFMKEYKYLAVFPDDPHNPGMIPYVSFYFRGDRAIFEPYGEMSSDYYYSKTKRIRAKAEEADRCLLAIERYYDTQFRVFEKLR